MPDGKPPYPNNPPYKKTDSIQTVSVPVGPVANQFEPGKAKRYAEESMALKDVRRNAAASRSGKRII